jgi:hypothetical protein
MQASDFILSRTVEYFAVYPGGRKCSVELSAVEQHADSWAAEGVTIETHVKVQNVPIYGMQVLVDS